MVLALKVQYVHGTVIVCCQPVLLTQFLPCGAMLTQLFDQKLGEQKAISGWQLFLNLHIVFVTF